MRTEMKMSSSLHSCPALLLLVLLPSLLAVGHVSGADEFSRNDFPSNFVFGACSSAYQVEGGAAEDGRTPSIWDIYTHQGMEPDKSTADVSCDVYHKHKEDVKIMSNIGLEAYRLSISWSRLLPYGRGAVNPKGLQYYNNVIDELIKHGIQPHVTIYHLDLPQILEEEYGGWLSPKIIKDFTEYANVCFREFGDRVSHWTTLNEPNVMSSTAYGTGQLAPRRCSQPGGYFNCTAGNSSVEPYIVMHNLLLSHASAVALYRDKYQAEQKGLIGFNVYAFWFISMTNLTADIEATQRATDFFTGWAVDPLVFGDYPESMKKNVGSRLPSFTQDESKLVKGSFDFMGLNHYIPMYVANNPRRSPGPGHYMSDMGVTLSVTEEMQPPGPFVPGPTPYNPYALQNLLEYFKDKYGNPPVYIQENGYGTPYNESLEDDRGRVHYISGYTKSILSAIRNGSNAIGYFVWSFLDGFEFLTGYETRYGMVHVNFEDKDLKRELKYSAKWYSSFIKNKKNIEEEIHLSYSSE